MYKFIKKSLLAILLLISFIGLISSMVGYTYSYIEKTVPDWIFSPILIIPLIFIPSIIVAITKIKKYSGKFYYGIRFYPAIQRVPKLMAVLIYVFLINLIVMVVLKNFGLVSETHILSSGMLIFYYIPFLIYLSALIELFR